MAWIAHKASDNPISIRDAAEAMGHTPATYLNFYGVGLVKHLSKLPLLDIKNAFEVGVNYDKSSPRLLTILGISEESTGKLLPTKRRNIGGARFKTAQCKAKNL